MNRRHFLTAAGGMIAGGLSSIDRLLALPTSGGPADVRAPLIGLNVQPGHAPWAVPYLQRARIGHVRASWWHWSTPQEWSWMSDFRDGGIEVLPLIYGGPDRRGIERYEALRRNFGPFPWVQLENEPDSEGANGARGEQFGRYLRRVADHIRQRDPGTKICSPGLGWTQPGVHDFMRGMISAAPDTFDALSIHIYGHHPYGEPLSRWREVRTAWGGEIWCTEMGQNDLSTRAFHGFRDLSRREYDDFQANAWRIALSEDESRFGYSRIYGFQLGWDDGGYGILNRDRSPRPAYRWLVDR